jgi:hypothetical protein
VDENLFYKGVDKSVVHGARLHQTHGLSDSLDQGRQATLSSSQTVEEEHPPYPFESGNTLLALTKKHNVGYFTSPG